MGHSEIETRNIDRCANAQCPNRVGQGAFETVSTFGPVVGGHRGITFDVCAPWAIALRELITGGGKRTAADEDTTGEDHKEARR